VSGSLAFSGSTIDAYSEGKTLTGAMVSVLAHEIEEAVTDPDLNAWYDRSGAENANECAWTFGTTYKLSNGSLANMRLGAGDYLVQQNWKAGSTQGCALSQ
jgi:hypothetical protein